jgi:hypothetical protein
MGREEVNRFGPATLTPLDPTLAVPGESADGHDPLVDLGQLSRGLYANLLGVEVLDLEIDHTPGRAWFRAGGKVEVRVRQPVPDQETVTCVIPGHHRSGRELFSDSIRVDAGPLVFSVAGRCAYESTFAYSSDDE